MSTTYDDAIATLYQAPLDSFVAERKRLAAELKMVADKEGAARLAKRGRPTIAAWTVNQLWWQARDQFDELLAASQRLRSGDIAAASAQREATAKLRARAVTLLEASPHSATEVTLRRVMTNISALAAAGGFEPDPPGALAADRDPPGFDLVRMTLPDAPPSEAAPSEATPPDAPLTDAARTGTLPRKDAQGARDQAERRRLEEQRRQMETQRRELEEQRRRAEQERVRKEAERRQLEGALHRAKRELESRKRQVDRLKTDLADAEKMRAQAETAVADIVARLGAP